MDYAHGFFTAIDRELDQHAKAIRHRVFSLYRDVPWMPEQYGQLQPVIRHELEAFVRSILEIFDNVGCGKVPDDVLGYQISVIPTSAVDENVLETDDLTDIRQDNSDYATLWSEFLLHKYEPDLTGTTENTNTT